MKHSSTACCLILFIFLFSCNTLKNPFAENKSPHEKYAERLINAKLENTTLGKAWFTSAGKALSNPQSITLPYSETGFFAADRPSAAGFIFSMEKGRQILLKITCNPADSVSVFVDLFKLENEKKPILTSMDTLNNEIKFIVKKPAIIL